ncbi:hypothetical protein PPL_05657 [Heterostelium album PN500]|uniref:EF-hand domain-containing protein n=1 Tax=Heterostelium pallidum (strain ATCC 26659 / Pp 5 / PN500) TaxID=670386 RepID=D3BAS6_HETP5|nr:hypothetical protein PPL_05657 [Heterostelium album PN500]EFA81663.1 hypothetical protein PPL_05657 [Heterostelium album PN500]|eukprot:XP_020433780.1 hypothetical protein PPL_05657 [Heterostelium album PN500]
MGHQHSKLTKDEINQLANSSSFTKSEVNELYHDFKKHDKDGNGVLDRNVFKPILQRKKYNINFISYYNNNYSIEFISFFSTRLPKFNSTQLNNLFDSFDSDGSGSVDFKELVVATSVIGKGTAEEKLGFMFDTYDKDKSGSLEKGEVDNIINMMISVGKAMGKSDKDITVFVNKLIEKVDVDKNQTITRDEWISQGSKSPSVLTLLGL